MSRTPRRPPWLVLVLVAAVVAGVGAGSLLLTMRGADDVDPGASPSPSAVGTPLAQVDTATAAPARDSFCKDVDPAAVLSAVGADDGDRVRTETWVNGQQASLEPGLSDVSHEYGCSWRVASSGSARAWVFAPPATPDEARALVAAAPRAEGCAVVPGAPAYGSPSVAVDCDVDGERTRTFAGLFGDAWLTCEVGAADRDDARVLAARASTWCPAVLSAAGA